MHFKTPNILYENGACTSKMSQFNVVFISLNIIFKHNLKKTIKRFEIYLFFFVECHK